MLLPSQKPSTTNSHALALPKAARNLTSFTNTPSSSDVSSPSPSLSTHAGLKRRRDQAEADDEEHDPEANEESEISDNEESLTSSTYRKHRP
jgi:hypothetical protein